MIYKNICSKREYEVNGVKKTVWLQVGTLRVNDSGKEFIELNLFPNTPLYVFPKKEREQPAQQEQSTGDVWLNEEQS